MGAGLPLSGLPTLWLASTSPRRSQLLQQAGIAFDLCEPGPEPDATGEPLRVAAERARSKAVGSRPRDRTRPVLGVDTVVDVDGVEHGKAKDRAEAERMLRALLGRVHRVHTGHCLWLPGRDVVVEETVTAEVVATVPSEADLQRYLDSEQWRGKAGAYGIQDPAQSFLRLHGGGFDTVMGLHVPAVLRLLDRLRVHR
ncbi:MAG: Maf family protein [Planctomycetes bacterium]|nr:Maf family protein [Planctomycetota bacterium]